LAWRFHYAELVGDGWLDQQSAGSADISFAGHSFLDFAALEDLEEDLGHRNGTLHPKLVQDNPRFGTF
jgi:hypothetical protein